MHDIRSPNILIRYLLLVLPHLILRILFMKQPGSKYSLHCNCFVHLVEEVKHLKFRNKYAGTVTTENPRRFRKRSHVVVIVQLHRFRIITRKPQSPYTLCVPKMRLLFHSILLDPKKQ